MPVVINGSTGISGTDGSASTPSVQGTDTNTGMFFPAADTIAFAEGGTEVMRLNSSGQVEYTAGTASLPSITTTGDTNTGIYFPGADRIGFAEGGAQVGEFDASGNFQFNSGYGSVATAYGCRAWVNFNGTGTVAIRASGNVSSITDNGTGDYTVNFTNAMPDADYSVVVSRSPQYGATTAFAVVLFTAQKGVGNWVETAPTSSGFRIAVASDLDIKYVTVAVFR